MKILRYFASTIIYLFIWLGTVALFLSITYALNPDDIADFFMNCAIMSFMVGLGYSIRGINKISNYIITKRIL